MGDIFSSRGKSGAKPPRQKQAWCIPARKDEYNQSGVSCEEKGQQVSRSSLPKALWYFSSMTYPHWMGSREVVK